MNMNFIFEMKVKAIIINQKTTKNQKKKQNEVHLTLDAILLLS